MFFIRVRSTKSMAGSCHPVSYHNYHINSFYLDAISRGHWSFLIMRILLTWQFSKGNPNNNNNNNSNSDKTAKRDELRPVGA